MSLQTDLPFVQAGRFAVRFNFRRYAATQGFDMRNSFLIVGAVLSGLAALLHVACIYFGAPWYRFLGAGEEMARMAESGSWIPGIITAGIAAVLGIWALYALSGAGAVRRLPLLRTSLCIITGIYLLRGIAVLPVVLLRPEQATAFLWWSSAICLGFGVVHLVGMRQRWQAMSVAAPMSALNREPTFPVR